ncbi:MAG: ABC transporter substrate-binding protein [Helicobacteraceae bacterium]
MKKFLLFAVAALWVLGQQMGGTIVFGRSGDASTLDPAQASDSETFYATTQVYDNLVQFKLGSTEVEPGLASSWDISKDGLEYTFHLKRGVYFAPTKYFKKRLNSQPTTLFSA